VLQSVGSIGDAYDNALARSQLELAVVEYIGWFNHTRLHESLGDLPPAEFKAQTPRAQAAPTSARDRPSRAGLSADR
jgi:putative transposase